MSLESIIGIALLFINLIALILVGYDKYKAESHGWRIAERSLFLVALAGGAAGVFLGMRFFRHKTRKPGFYLGIPLLVVVNLIIFYHIFQGNHSGH